MGKLRGLVRVSRSAKLCLTSLIIIVTFLATSYPVEAGLDFTIDFLGAQKTQYNYSETAQIWARIKNTGTVEIDTAEANFTLTAPSGATAFTYTDGKTIYLDPGQLEIFEALWTIPNNAETGLYDISVSITAWTTGKSEIVTRSAQANDAFSVNAPPAPDYTLSISPSSKAITQGESAVFDITVTSLNGWSNPVTLTVSGLPSGATASLSSNPVTPTATSTLTITTTPSVQTGQFTIVVEGTSGTKIHTTFATLLVQAQQQPSFDFSVSASPSLITVLRGKASVNTATVTVGLINGTSNRVDLIVEGLPSNVGATALSPLYGNPPFTSNLSFAIVEIAPVGRYYLNVTGYGGGENHSAPIILDVIEPPELRFDTHEAYFPANLYFDDGNVTNNHENYPTQNPPPYYVYYRIENRSSYYVFEYWYYYAFNYHQALIVPEHEHDFEWVYIWVNKTSNKPFYLVGSQHFPLLPLNKFPITSFDNLFVYVANGSHGMAHRIEDLKDFDHFDDVGVKVGKNHFSFLNIDTTIKMNETQDLVQNEYYYKTNELKGDIFDRFRKVKAPWKRDEYNNPDKFLDKTIASSLHSPATLHVYDWDGNHAGLNSSGEIENKIPDVIVYNYTLKNETKWIAVITNSSINYTMYVNATGEGNFTLVIKSQMLGTDEEIAFENVPLTNKTVAKINSSSIMAKEYRMDIDSQGDGVYEQNTTSNYDLTTNMDLTKNASSTLFTALANKTISIAASHIGTYIDLLTNDSITKGTVNITGYSSSPASELQNKVGLYLVINASQDVKLKSASILTYYSDSEVNNSGLNENTLSFYNWDENSSAWVRVNSTVNTAENYVTANLSHFSYYAISGGPASTESSTPSSSTGGGGGGGGGGGIATLTYLIVANDVDWNLATPHLHLLDGNVIRYTAHNYSLINKSIPTAFKIIFLGGPDALDGVGNLVRNFNPTVSAVNKVRGTWYYRDFPYKNDVVIFAGRNREETNSLFVEWLLQR